MQNDTNSLLYQSRKEAEKWLTYPIHSLDKKKIKVLLNKKNQEELIDCFHNKLQFGTGGIRGKINMEKVTSLCGMIMFIIQLKK